MDQQVDICAICQEPNDLILSHCGHLFHLHCIQFIIRPTCPLCRSILVDFLIENGVSKEEIIQKMVIDDYRILFDEIFPFNKRMEDCFLNDLRIEKIILNLLSMNYYDLYEEMKNIIISIISNTCEVFQKNLE